VIRERLRSTGFTLIEIIVVVAILAVITTAASVALGRMFGLWRQVRTAALVDQNARSELLDLSRQLRSARSVRCEPRVVQTEAGRVNADTLVYEMEAVPGEPEQPARVYTVRLVPKADADDTTGLARRIQSDSEMQEPVIILPEAVGVQVRCLTLTGWTAAPASDARAVAMTVWVQPSESGRTPRIYSTAVNLPRTLRQDGT
jgi:prepilin-type N-terminal cleavage/methylation domain-containing protein